ncbi:MAG: NnrS family protein [Rubellimicrobium sp.]|nr:NnrS family protein [Rubellimicrobium sp.]
MHARLSSVWLMPHRPLFLAMGIWAVVAVAWWQWGAQAGLPAPALGTPALWHAHEMVAGMGGAAVGAYLLTALAGWSGRESPAGLPLKVLVALWLLARVAAACAALLPVWAVGLPGALYFLMLGAMLARGIAAARAWRRLAAPLAVGALGLGDALLLRAALSGGIAAGAGIAQAMVRVLALMISVIGGRMVPAFTDSALRRRGHAGLPPGGRIAALAGAAAILVALGLTLAGKPAASGIALFLAGALQFARLARWRGWRVAGDALLAALHLGFLWLALGLVLLGAARLWPAALPESDLLHALTMGAIGGMILAVAIRAAAGRAGGALIGGRPAALAGAAIAAATLLRIAVAVLPAAGGWLLPGAAAFWMLGWALFLTAFLPTALGPVRRPVFSGARV